MPEHLNRERISALLDDPASVPGALQHIAECAECSREYEQMSRMRMALSGLTDLEAPRGEWEAIRERLGLEQGGGGVRFWRSATRLPLQAAAVLALFAAGLLVGQRLGGAGAEGGEPVASTASLPAADSGSETVEPQSPLSIEPTEAYLRTVADLQSLRHRFADDARQGEPEAVAERITHLDAMIRASREALREAPEDPVLNNFLFQLVDERDQLAGQLDRTLRMTAAEY